jgi:TIR domain
MTNVFISYSHHQAIWVRQRLAPVLKAAGATLMLDVIDGEPGKSLTLQMNEWVGGADRIVAVMSEAYWKSAACQHEWMRALARDPDFSRGKTIIPVLREDCQLPDEITRANPLYLKMIHDRVEDQWRKLLEACGGSLGTNVVDWLDALEEMVLHLERRKSVNLVASNPVKWKALIEAAGERLVGGLPSIDLNDPILSSRPALLNAWLKVLGVGGGAATSNENADIGAFSEVLRELPPLRTALHHFGLCRMRADFNSDFFNVLYHHTMTDRVKIAGVEQPRLTLLLHTDKPLGVFMPKDNPVSKIDCASITLRPLI